MDDDESAPRGNSFLKAVATRLSRLISFYVGSAERNTIEYWQRYVFYVITFAGIIAGTICIIPAGIWIVSTGRPAGLLTLSSPTRSTSASSSSLASPSGRRRGLSRSPSPSSACIPSILAGPEGESGIWFSVSVLILSLFVSFKASLAMAAFNFATE